MKTLSQELKINEVNTALSKVRGLGFQTPEIEKAQKDNIEEIISDMRIEETNNRVNEITGLLNEEVKLKKKILAEDKKKLNESSDSIDELKDLIDQDLREALENLLDLAEQAYRTATKIGGEYDRVVAGQLRNYFIGNIKDFLDNEHQAGSIASLLRFIEEQEEVDEEESKDFVLDHEKIKFDTVNDQAKAIKILSGVGMHGIETQKGKKELVFTDKETSEDAYNVLLEKW